MLPVQIFLPDYGIAFEYQGELHFHEVPIYSNRAGLKRKIFNDNRKQCISKELGIDLICIPYWWNGSIESIAATVNTVRKDFIFPFSDCSSTMPQYPPLKNATSEIVSLYQGNKAYQLLSHHNFWS